MKVAVTGANGRIGRALRPGLLQQGLTLRVSDLEGTSADHDPAEELLLGNIIEPAFVDRLLEDVEVLIHLAATSNEQAFELILDNNHRGLYEIYEGARRHGVRRVIYASSNHAFGLHPVGPRLRLDAPYAADCFYGLSKIWGESLGQMYWEKHGIETVALRIGSFFNVPPRNLRELSTWLGLEDFNELIRCAIHAPDVGFAPVWGISANSRAYYDYAQPNRIAYVPRQNAEDWAAAATAQSPAADPVADRYQGGRFVTQSYTPDADRRRRRT
jgi:uronate dehydrogenase